MNTEWIWHHLYKAPSKVDQDNYYTSLPSGFVTDGFGNLYKIPKEGKLPLRSINGDREYKFTYNWETKEIEVYVYDLGADNSEVNNYVYLASYSVSPENFVDNPDYWYNVALSELHSEIEGELENIKASEAYELYGEIIDEDKDEYEYEIHFTYDVIVQDLPESYSSWEELYNSIESVLAGYSVDSELYGEKLSVKYSVNESTAQTYLLVKFPLPLTKEELLDIWDSFLDSDEVNSLEGAIEIFIDDIYEV